MTHAEAQLEFQSRDGGTVAVLTVSNPEKLNCLGSELLTDLQVKLSEMALSADLRVAVLQGAGDRSFIGGADINELAKLDKKGARAFITSVHGVCQGLRDLPVPVIAKIQGYCLGAGLEIAASCDLRVATEQSQFGMPEVVLGVPSVVEAALLPQLVGWGRTRELVFGGKSYMAREVEGWGLVQRVVAPGEIDPATNQWIEAILRAGPRAIRLQKKLLRRWEDLPLSEAIEAGIDAFVDAFDTDEPRERIQGFLERRGLEKRPVSVPAERSGKKGLKSEKKARSKDR